MPARISSANNKSECGRIPDTLPEVDIWCFEGDQLADIVGINGLNTLVVDE